MNLPVLPMWTCLCPCGSPPRVGNRSGHCQLKQRGNVSVTVGDSFKCSCPRAYSLLINHYSLHITHYSLHITHYSLLITHYSLLITHYSLLITHYSSLITHYSTTGPGSCLLITHYSLLITQPQAMDRAHRLGQTRTVNVYRLLMAGTLEEKIMGLQQFKMDMANTVSCR